MGIIRSKCAWLVLALLVSASPVGSAPDEPRRKPQLSPGSPPEPRPPADDTSLSLDAYIAAGMPAYDRSWTGTDMEKAFKVLQKLAKDKGRLPRYGSERSGKLFDRMASEDNLEFCDDPSDSLTKRYSSYSQYIDALKGISDLYESAFATDSAYRPDCVEIVNGAGQRAVSCGLKLADEIVSALDKSDPSYARKMKGLDLMKRGAATMAAGCLKSLEDIPSEQLHTRMRLVGHIKSTLPDIFPRLPPGSRAEILVRLQELARKPSMNDVKADLEELDKQLRRSASAR
jgi:hypothetical protein